MRCSRIAASLVIASFLLFVLGWREGEAQIQSGWTAPFQLSTGQGDAAEASLVTDAYGFVHAFWVEVAAENTPLIQYARYDGTNWTVPTDIYAGRPSSTIGNIAVKVDPSNRLHLVWSAGITGPAFYIHAPAHDAFAAQNWSSPLRISVPAGSVELQVDAEEVLHVLYTRDMGNEAGLYYTRSEDQGLNWTAPFWIDPDILSGHQPARLQFLIDEAGGLHATWYYVSLNQTGGDWVRYTHSLDGGSNWIAPQTIDRLTEAEMEAEESLSAAYPVMAVSGDNVHIIWAGGQLHYRHHRYSEDRGATWSEPSDIFGTLNGQAGDGMTVDSDGRIHFFSQIRYPQAIYHAVWEEGRWSSPAMVYLISLGDGDPMGDRIHAHRTYPIVRNGNELILTFTDPPPEDGRRLFVTSRILRELTMTTVEPTPQPAATGENAGPTVTPEPTQTMQPASNNVSLPPANTSRPDRAIWFGVAPTILLAAGVILIQLLMRLHFRR